MEKNHNLTDPDKNISAYDSNKANRYDKESEVIRGNRNYHRDLLLDLLNYIKYDQKVFIDLGCGTGELSKLFFEVFPKISGYLIDGSEEMLTKSKERFREISNDIFFHVARLEHLDWGAFKIRPDIIFSSFAIHHLEDNQKWKLYQNVYASLAQNGVFILFDYFQPKEERSIRLLEYLACMDIKRRAEAKLRKKMDINIVIKNDRKAKEAEGDKEGSLEEHTTKFLEIGFKDVTVIFKEARLAGIIAFKK